MEQFVLHKWEVTLGQKKEMIGKGMTSKVQQEMSVNCNKETGRE